MPNPEAFDQHALIPELHRQLISSGLTVAAAESITGGRIQSALSSQSGSSRYFLGGVTAYALRQKVDILGVEPLHAAQVNCVSAAVAEQMARGALKLFRADIALSATGYAEPSPEHGAETACAYLCLAAQTQELTPFISQIFIESKTLGRLGMQQWAASTALSLLRDFLRRPV